jgi:hypothetical protein
LFVAPRDAGGFLRTTRSPNPEFDADPALAGKLASQTSDEEYEAKIARLLKRCFAADVAADSHARDVWREAYRVLQEGDYYISIVIDRAVGPQMKHWWQFWR